MDRAATEAQHRIAQEEEGGDGGGGGGGGGVVVGNLVSRCVD